MKSEYKEENVSSVYPKLMIDDRVKNEVVVVLLNDYGDGTVVYSENQEYLIGYNSDTWNQGFFRDFTGEITLSN